MKTWNEIENRLKSENHRDEPPRDLHDRIMRAVRDDRAAATIAAPEKKFPGVWLFAGAFAALVVAALFTFSRPAPQSKISQAAPAPESSAFSLASIEAVATAPVENEVQNLNADFASAAKFIAGCLPGEKSGT